MKNAEYHESIRTAQTLDELDAIVENASFDETLTNNEYCDIYSAALNKAQSL